jgi:nucleotidyltransferase/DNA polymerase involved in DNA repair
MTKKFIVHVDMDAFFAAIEQRDNPALRGKPVVVGADPKNGKGRGVVSTSSYEARKFGIHSAMPISAAYRKCPHAAFLPVDMGKYHSVSRRIYNIFYEFTPEVEPISIDEAFLDITGSFHLFGTPRETCSLIKSRIKKETRLTSSVGLAPTKMAAKIASDLEKPDGFVEVPACGLVEFLRPLDISKIWGLGKKSEVILRKSGINTVGELADRDRGELVGIFGKCGAHFWDLANGIDERSVETEHEAKSIGNEITFERDTREKRVIQGTLMRLCEKVSNRLRREGLKGKTVTLKIRLEGFKTYTRAVTLEGGTNFADVLYKEVEKLYNRFDRNERRVRLLGVQVSNFSQMYFRDTLFLESADEKREKVHKALDNIKNRFGDTAIKRASGKI